MINRDAMIWLTGSGESTTWDNIIQIATSHVEHEGIVFVGCDSQVHANKCTFIEAICLHGASGQQGGRYFYRRSNITQVRDITLRERVTDEASYAIELAMKLVPLLPADAKIEIHLDVSANKAHASSSLSESLSGFARAMGFTCKIKPDSWAAFCVADGHTR